MPPKIVEKMLSFWSSKCYLWIFSGFTNLEDTQDDEGWCDGGSLLGRESLESFLIPPLFNRHNIGKHLIPPQKRCVPNHMHQIFQAVWPTVASRGEFGQ